MKHNWRNPFGKYIKSTINASKKQYYKLLSKFLELCRVVEETVSIYFRDF